MLRAFRCGRIENHGDLRPKLPFLPMYSNTLCESKSWRRDVSCSILLTELQIEFPVINRKIACGCSTWFSEDSQCFLIGKERRGVLVEEI